MHDYYVNFRFFAFRAHFASLFFVFESRFVLLAFSRIFYAYSRVVFLKFFGNVRPTQKRVFHSRAPPARFSSLFLVFSRSASRTLIVWGGCRFRPYSQSRNLCHSVSMSLYNRVKASTVVEQTFSSESFSQNPFCSTSLERACHKLSVDTCLIAVSQLV